MTEVAILALASLAVARIIAAEEVSKPLREHLSLWVAESPDRPAPVRWLNALVRCTVCVGAWATIGLHWAGVGHPWTWTLAEAEQALAAWALLVIAEYRIKGWRN